VKEITNTKRIILDIKTPFGRLVIVETLPDTCCLCDCGAEWAEPVFKLGHETPGSTTG